MPTKNLYDLRTGSEKLKEIELALDYINDVLVSISNLAISGDIIGDVHANLAEIEICSTNITSIVATATDIVNVNTVAADIANVIACATNIINIDKVGSDIANVNSLAGLETEIATLSAISLNITTVAGIASSVTAVANIASDVTDVNTEPFKSAIVANNTEPQKTSILNAGANATKAELEAWVAEAEAMTAEAYAKTPIDALVSEYTSDGDGTFTATPTDKYSSLHYAAKSLQGAISSGQVGQIIEFAGTTAPTGYLVCDGSEVSQTTYADLFSIIGTTWDATGGVAAPAVGNFRIPPSQIGNLGLYKRGVGVTNGAVGTYQEDAFKSHTHGIQIGTSAGNGSYEGGGFGTVLRTNLTNSTGDATETRPRSITILMCIKY